MDWLETRLQLRQIKESWELTDSDEDAGKLASMVRQIVFNHDLRFFNTVFAQTIRTGVNNALESALRALTERHCPPYVTTMLRDKLGELKKAREMSVDQYANEFEKLLDMAKFVRIDIAARDRGLPLSWRTQVEFVSIKKEDEALLELRTSYKTCERLEQVRNQRARGHRNGGSEHQGRKETGSRQRQDTPSQRHGGKGKRKGHVQEGKSVHSVSLHALHKERTTTSITQMINVFVTRSHPAFAPMQTSVQNKSRIKRIKSLVAPEDASVVPR